MGAQVKENEMDDFDDVTCEEYYDDTWMEEDALASAGWGVDESYVSDNDYFDDVPF